MHLYVTEQCTRLGKNGGHLVVQRDGCTIDDILLSEVDSLSLFGAVHPTTDAMLALLDKGADIAFLSSGGHYRGRLISAVGKMSLCGSGNTTPTATGNGLSRWPRAAWCENSKTVCVF